MPKTLAQTLDDPEFRKLKPLVQKSVLKKLGVSDDMQTKLLLKLGREKIASQTPEPKHGGFSAFMSDAAGAVTGIAKGALGTVPGMELIPEKYREPLGIHTPMESGMESAAQLPEDWRARRAAGYSVPYRLLAPVAEQNGVNVKGMEEAAKSGDPGAVIGHAAFPVAALAAGEAFGRGVRAIKPKADITVPEHLKGRTKEQIAKYNERVEKAREDHAAKLADHKEKLQAEQAVNDATSVAQKNIQSTHQVVRAALDSRWEALRNKWNKLKEANPAASVGDPATIYNGVREAEKRLHNSPQSLQQFRNIIRELGVEDFVENEDGTLSAANVSNAKPFEWQAARTHYTAIGDKLGAGGLPGNVYQALKDVQTKVLDPALQQAADRMGAGQEYKVLKDDWSEYQRDWKDTSAVSRGGSPLAHVLQMPDAGFARRHMTGPAADRMLRTLEKYRSQGAQPELVERVRNLEADSKLPKPKRVSVPKPEPKLSTPAKVAVHTAVRGASLVAGSALGHPYYGLLAGEPLSHAAVRALETRKARALARQVPVDMVPED